MYTEIAKDFLHLLQMPIDKNSVEGLEEQVEKSKDLLGTNLSIPDYKNKIQQACREIGKNKIQEIGKNEILKREHELFHTVYALASKLYWALFHSIPHLDKEQQNILDGFIKNKNYVFNQKHANLINEGLKPVFDRLAELNKNLPKNFEPKNVTRRDYTIGAKLPNQIPLEDLTESELSNIAMLFQETGIGDVIVNYYQSNFGAGNIRVWRYISSTGKGKGVGVHRDGLPPHSFKFMCFNGHVTKRHGCFEVMKNKKSPLIQVVGLNPCIMVVPNDLYHRALTPSPGLFRDAIEITIEPYLGDTPIFVDAGCIAGNPLNPFSDWTER